MNTNEEFVQLIHKILTSGRCSAAKRECNLNDQGPVALA